MGEYLNIARRIPKTPGLRTDIADTGIGVQTKLESERAIQMLQRHGWVAIRSQALDDVVIWTLGKTVAVPYQYASCIRYTLDEISTLLDGTVDPEGLKLVHEAKKAFVGGKVVANVDGSVEVKNVTGLLYPPELDQVEETG